MPMYVASSITLQGPPVLRPSLREISSYYIVGIVSFYFPLSLSQSLTLSLSLNLTHSLSIQLPLPLPLPPPSLPLLSSPLLPLPRGWLINRFSVIIRLLYTTMVTTDMKCVLIVRLRTRYFSFLMLIRDTHTSQPANSWCMCRAWFYSKYTDARAGRHSRFAPEYFIGMGVFYWRR